MKMIYTNCGEHKLQKAGAIQYCHTKTTINMYAILGCWYPLKMWIMKPIHRLARLCLRAVGCWSLFS